MSEKQLRAFNLEEAKAGKPICTKMGQPIRFIAHVPEATGQTLVVLGYNGEVTHYHSNGAFMQNGQKCGLDLCMAEDLRDAVAEIFNRFPDPTDWIETKQAIHDISLRMAEDLRDAVAEIINRFPDPTDGIETKQAIDDILALVQR